MKRLCKIVLLLLTAAILGACRKDSIDTYSVADSAVVFTTSTFSFSLKGDTRDIVPVSLNLRLIGPATDYDRQVSFRVVESDGSNASEGDDFVLTGACIKAGELSGTIDIEIVNNLNESVPARNMVIEIVPNEYFRKGIVRYSSAVVQWSEEYVRPKEAVWRYWFVFFSKYYSKAYHELLVSEFGEEIEHVTNSVSLANQDPDISYRHPSWWYGATRQFREMVRAHDEANPDNPLMHSSDCLYYQTYTQADGSGSAPEELPTILSTLNVL